MSTLQDGQSRTTTDYYDTLGLQRGESTEILHDKLGELRLGWSSKAARAGGMGDQARTQLILIQEAEAVFTDDDTRDRYDVQLRRTPRDESAQVEVDWLTKAWSYYFIDDNGAADVSARKARDQRPSDAMVFVVSSWVKLREGELKQAKQFVDEAFVLDELGEDTADVHHARGAVFLSLALNREGSQYGVSDPEGVKLLEQAQSSLDRALAKASPEEQAEIQMRKAWAYEASRNRKDAIAACRAGLSETLGASGSLRGRLEATISEISVAACNEPKTPAMKASAFRQQIASLEASDVQGDSKRRIVDFLRQSADSWDQVDKYDKAIATNQAVQGPSGSKPVPGCISIGLTIVFVLIALTSFASNAGGVGVFFLLAAAGVGGYIAMVVGRRNTYDQAVARLQSAQSALKSAQDNRNKTIRKLDGMKALSASR